MWDFSLKLALKIMLQTMPFVLFRVFVYFGMVIAYILVTGIGSGVGYGIGGFGDLDFQASSTLWGGGVGFALTAGIIYFLREYILYVVKAGHVAVMVKLLEGSEIPNGRSQINYAKEIVTHRFGQASVLFALDQLIKGVLKVATRLVQGLMSIIPIPGLSQIMGIVRAFLRISIGLIDEVIFAHAIHTNAQNPWESGQEALVLYAQNAGKMMKNAAWLTVIIYILSFFVFLIMLAPAAAIVYLIPGAWSASGIVVALLFAWAIKVALIEPLAIACMLQVFFKVTAGQNPNPEWVGKLNNASAKFQKMSEKAGDWVGHKFNAENSSHSPSNRSEPK